MKRQMIRILTLLAVLVFAAPIAIADERYVLKYDSPASEKPVVSRGKGKRPPKFGFMQTALPLGNGRLGAMFTGGIDAEHLVTNGHHPLDEHQARTGSVGTNGLAASKPRGHRNGT